jgi:hypothetical protein
MPDPDTKFTTSFDEVFAAIGIEAIRSPVRSPKEDAFAERWVRTAFPLDNPAAKPLHETGHRRDDRLTRPLRVGISERFRIAPGC